jgi:hypothetical protein
MHETSKTTLLTTQTQTKTHNTPTQAYSQPFAKAATAFAKANMNADIQSDLMSAAPLRIAKQDCGQSNQVFDYKVSLT